MKTPKIRQSIERQAVRPGRPEHNKQPAVTTIRPTPPTLSGVMGGAAAITSQRQTGQY